MKAFFDTSVLVATFYGDHQHHDASIDRFLSFRRSEACCAAHSLAEVYSSLTRMPGKWRVGGDQAMLFLATVRERLTIVVLDEDEYFRTIEDASTLAVGAVPSTMPSWHGARSKRRRRRSTRGT